MSKDQWSKVETLIAIGMNTFIIIAHWIIPHKDLLLLNLSLTLFLLDKAFLIQLHQLQEFHFQSNLLQLPFLWPFLQVFQDLLHRLFTIIANQQSPSIMQTILKDRSLRCTKVICFQFPEILSMHLRACHLIHQRTLLIRDKPETLIRWQWLNIRNIPQIKSNQVEMEAFLLSNKFSTKSKAEQLLSTQDKQEVLSAIFSSQISIFSHKEHLMSLRILINSLNSNQIQFSCPLTRPMFPEVWMLKGHSQFIRNRQENKYKNSQHKNPVRKMWVKLKNKTKLKRIKNKSVISRKNKSSSQIDKLNKMNKQLKEFKVTKLKSKRKE